MNAIIELFLVSSKNCIKLKIQFYNSNELAIKLFLAKKAILIVGGNALNVLNKKIIFSCFFFLHVTVIRVYVSY